ncbi:Imm7 family immunity protein [Streptomyces sp. NPDC047061]|uniref:Imm7 family immunity protein n=1 Tax=Streptomyces sp. NPDC047061 TaxID=3154605 RepID=UPI0033F1B044
MAPGSPGLLLVHDDEEPGHENEVRVLRLVRSIVTPHGGVAVPVHPYGGGSIRGLRRPTARPREPEHS